MPVSWLRAHASPPILLRTLTEILPPDATTHEEVESAREDLLQYKGVTQITKKQRTTGIWAGNILGTGPSKTLGIKDIGSIAQYRRLIELGLPADSRTFQRANRMFFRLLSRDKDPKLLFEYEKLASEAPGVAEWARQTMREAVTAALAQAGVQDDPRVRGSAHRITNELSEFLRSNLAEKPIARKGTKHVLDPDAHPPTLHSIAMIAYLPALQRERASFVDRLQGYLSEAGPNKAFVLAFGKKTLKPTNYILGDPLHNDSAGRPKDLPFALHWMELLARMNILQAFPTAQRALGRLLKDCNKDGVWEAKNLRAFPKSPSGLADFAFPLELDDRSAESKRADVTFRLAYLAKLTGLDLEYT
ncbi:MAG: hypothetical protein O7I93_05045 [Gemmatimonadetes bacterium]|nr:hypothetical protein [Gemmatimonadota bacterium]